MWSARVGVVVAGGFGFWGNLFDRVECKGLDFIQLGHKKNKIRDEVIKTSTFSSSQIKPMRQKRRRDSSEESGGRVDRSYNNKSVRVQVYGSGDPGPSLEVWNGGGRAPRVLSTNCTYLLVSVNLGTKVPRAFQRPGYLGRLASAILL